MNKPNTPSFPGTRMKNTSQLLLFFLLLFSSSLSGQNLKTDSTVNSIFTAQEISDLEKILNFFTHQICEVEDINKIQAAGCFESYFKNLEERSRGSSHFNLKLSLEKQKTFYNSIDTSTFNDIWHYQKLQNLITRDTIIELSLDPGGKYAEFLHALGQEYDKVGLYYDDLKACGGISPVTMAELMKNYQEFPFNDERIRLLFAIHYLTLNDQFSEYMGN